MMSAYGHFDYMVSQVGVTLWSIRPSGQLDHVTLWSVTLVQSEDISMSEAIVWSVSM